MKVGWGPLLVVGLALGLAVAAPAAGDSIGTRKATVDGRIADLRSHIGAAQQNEGVLTSQLSEVTRELRASQSAVDEAESTLAGLEVELGNQRARLDVLSSGLKVQTERLQRLRSEYARPLTVLETRLQGIYKSESPDMLSFLVSATSFGELVDNYRMLSRIGRQDQLVALDVRAAKSRAAAAHRATTVTRQETLRTVRRIADRTDEARVARDHLIAGRNSLAAARKLKASSLADVRETRASYLAEVTALQAQSEALAQAIRAAQDGSTSDGSGVSSSGLIWPVQGAVTSGFGMRWGRMHDGIDIAVPTGTPVHAAAAGIVIYASWMTGYGNLVVIDHGNGLATAYAHNSSLVVTVGQHVEQGRTISLSGSTGNSTGPHVHFEVRVNGVPVDPLRYL